jgi:hypothetical protein
MSSLNYTDKIKVGNSYIPLWQIKAGLGGEGNSGDFTYIRDITVVGCYAFCSRRCPAVKLIAYVVSCLKAVNQWRG